MIIRTVKKWLRLAWTTITALVLFFSLVCFAESGEEVEASGGDETLYGMVGGELYRYHVFTNSGLAELAVSSGGMAECLVIAGGGGGGDRVGAGGGAGGLILEEIELAGGSNYVVTVGAGGEGVISSGSGGDGESSTFGPFTALGGGGGGGHNDDGRDGGSGGGAPGYAGNEPGSGEPGQGNPGGYSGNYGAGGGGGAGDPGGDWKGSHTGGDGGEGVFLGDWLGGLNLGDDGWFAGGGGGGSYRYSADITASEGGRGGGGLGGLRDASPGSGGANTGGGGGGRERDGDAGHGGSGIVIVRYPAEPEYPFIPVDEPLVLADLETGSSRFTNADEVGIVEFPLPDGYTHYQFSESGDVSTIDENAWISADPRPLQVSFTQPASDTNVSLYVWFTNTAESVWVRRAEGNIIYTLVSPVPMTYPDLKRGLDDVSGFAVYTAADIDAGSPGGISGGMEMDVVDLSLSSDADTTPGAPEVTFNALGSYEILFTVMNEAGNKTSVQGTVQVVPAGTYAYYVDADNVGNADAPFTNWPTAATNIQDAILQAEANLDPAGGVHSEVVIAEGIYVIFSELLITEPITMRSANGDPASTIVSGGWPVSSNRCLRLTADAVVQGLTFTNGYAWAASEPLNYGGGIFMTAGTVSNCRIIGNRAMRDDGVTTRGAGVYMEGGTLSNCVIRANTSDGCHGYGVFAVGENSLVTDCRILDNGHSETSNTSGGGLYLQASARAVRCVIAGNAARTSAGGVYIHGQHGHPLLSDSVVSNNFAWSGGGVFVYYYGDVENSRIVHNEANRTGGGIHMNSRGSYVRNCLIAGNQAGTTGGGVHNAGGQSGSVSLQNLTVANNLSEESGGGIHVSGINNDMEMYNSIIFDNLAETESNNVYFASNVPVAEYNCTTPGLVGEGNIADTPVFTMPGQGHGLAATLGDYTLRPISPCRDSGRNEAWMLTAVDILGAPRIQPQHGIVDMGAYEATPVRAGTIILLR